MQSDRISVCVGLACCFPHPRLAAVEVCDFPAPGPDQPTAKEGRLWAFPAPVPDQLGADLGLALL